MDFCAGIGAGRIGLQKAGFQCRACAEIDPKAHLTYQTFFGSGEQNFGDLMNIRPETLPDFDLLLAGFPCQSFSLAGKRLGLDDPRGKIVHGIAQILKAKNIKYFLLENVRGLVNHDGGKTMRHILNLLDKAGYHVRRKVLNTNDF